MTFVNLPKTDLNVSPICLGTGEIGSSLDRAASFALLDRYVELGGAFLDTARVYGDWVPNIERSVSEKTIGLWLKERGNRDSLVIGTKGAHWLMDKPDIPRLQPADIVSDLDGSLRDLQTDRIDLYWLHRDDPKTPVETILDTLDAQQKAGKIRYYGASNWQVGRLREAQAYAEQRGYAGFVADQVLWNAAVLANYPYGDFTVGFMDESRFIHHEKTRMATLAFQPQAYGLFHRMQKRDARPDESRISRLLPDAGNHAPLRANANFNAGNWLLANANYSRLAAWSALRHHPDCRLPHSRASRGQHDRAGKRLDSRTNPLRHAGIRRKVETAPLAQADRARILFLS